MLRSVYSHDHIIEADRSTAMTTHLHPISLLGHSHRYARSVYPHNHTPSPIGLPSQPHTKPDRSTHITTPPTQSVYLNIDTPRPDRSTLITTQPKVQLPMLPHRKQMRYYSYLYINRLSKDSFTQWTTYRMSNNLLAPTMAAQGQCEEAVEKLSFGLWGPAFWHPHHNWLHLMFLKGPMVMNDAVTGGLTNASLCLGLPRPEHLWPDFPPHLELHLLCGNHITMLHRSTLIITQHKPIGLHS